MINQKLMFYILAVISVLLMLSSISGILLPFVLAAVLAYMLDPLVDKLESKKISRGITSAVIVSILFSIIFLVLALAVPLIADGVREINNIISNFDAILTNKILPIIQPILPEGFNKETLVATMQAHSNEITTFVANSAKKLALSTMKVFDLVSFFLITPLALYYLLKDWDRILDAIHTLFPQNDQSYVSKIIDNIDNKLSSFIRGQLLVCFILGCIYAVGLSLIGLKLGLVIGFLTGLFSFIPFVGMLLGSAIAFIVAFLQFPLTDIQPFVLIACVFMLGQALEGGVLSPKLVGDALGLHPLWIIFAVMAGGELGGFLGVLIALPVSAIISVIVIELITYYKKTNIYANKKAEDIEQEG